MTARVKHGRTRVGARARGWCLSLVFLAAGAAGAPGVPPAPALERLDTLIASQAWQLALRAIDSLPDEVYAEELERRRLLIYRHLPDIAALAGRIERLPAAASPEFRRWALEQLVDASLVARDFAHAHAALERLLAAADDSEARPWRERLVRAFLAEGRTKEALAAFAPLAGQEEARTLHAEVLLHAGQDREAFERVAGLRSPEARLWRVIAATRLDLYAPADAVQELALLVRRLADRPDLQRLAWLVRADAARRIGQLAPRVNSLEQALRLSEAPAHGLATASADDLWSAYLALGRHVAQAESLSLGSAALERADAYRQRDAYAARALYAWHAIEANDAGVRTDAHTRLVAELSERGLGAVTRVLYTDSKRFMANEVPPQVRRALMLEALRSRDLPAAAKYARDLAVPPPGVSAPDWHLHRARVLLYGGEHDAAMALLQEVVAAEGFDAELAQRFLQVVFDLQALGEHDNALGLLESVHARVDNARMHRELLYWRAESAGALKRFTEAAELYLRSARFGAEDGRDPWGHSARFRAAEALTKAGLRGDAERLYRGLLDETSDPDRRLLIKQNLERLWLAAPAATTP